jgi:flavorubredoxin
MPSTVLFSSPTHRNVLLPEFGEGAAVQANQHLIIDSGGGMVLDPGGHKVYAKVLNETFAQLGGGKLRHLFLSHQDPDIVAAVNGWLMTTDVTAWCSALWTRFIPHFGVDKLVVERLKGLPDSGGLLELGTIKLQVIPAHFLHSPGNFQVYDPVSKILYSGDLGASLGQNYLEVPDFDAHLQYMEGFHQRYMSGQRRDAGLGEARANPRHRAHRPAARRVFPWQGDGRTLYLVVRAPRGGHRSGR